MRLALPRPHTAPAHITVQYSKVQYITVHHYPLPYTSLQYSTVQYSTVQYSTVQYSPSKETMRHRPGTAPAAAPATTSRSTTTARDQSRAPMTTTSTAAAARAAAAAAATARAMTTTRRRRRRKRTRAMGGTTMTSRRCVFHTARFRGAFWVRMSPHKEMYGTYALGANHHHTQKMCLLFLWVRLKASARCFSATESVASSVGVIPVTSSRDLLEVGGVRAATSCDGVGAHTTLHVDRAGSVLFADFVSPIRATPGSAVVKLHKHSLGWRSPTRATRVACALDDDSRTDIMLPL